MVDRITKLGLTLIGAIGSSKDIAVKLSSDDRRELLTMAKLSKDETTRAEALALTLAAGNLDDLFTVWPKLTEEDRRLLFAHLVNAAIPPSSRTLEELTHST
jgi:hypothetical protein